jgi:Ca2+-binding EF-hand superfamily protein
MIKRPNKRASISMQVYQLFLEIDTNGDGMIDTKELRKALKSFGYNLTDAEVEQLMLRMDLNNNGTVDFSELAACLIDWQQFQALHNDWNTWVDRIFERLDTDGSGYVDLQEIMECAPAALRCHTDVSLQQLHFSLVHWFARAVSVVTGANKLQTRASTCSPCVS